MYKILQMSAIDLGKSIKNREITVLEAAEAYLAAAETGNGDLNAFITITRERAEKQAAEVQKKIDSGALRSPLAGVPVAVKDNIFTRGVLTTCGSKMMSGFVSPYDAHIVERLESAGMIVIGKTNLDEFAMGSTGETSYFGPAKNPWDLSRTTGGSSSGSAAAVSARMAPLSLGSDTGGSIRIPASYCGITGMKPTYGAVSRYGMAAHASSLDQAGVFAGTARECAALLDVIGGRDWRDETSRDSEEGFSAKLGGGVENMRIAAVYGGIDAVSDEKVRLAAEIFEGLGAQTDIISIPWLKHAVQVYMAVSCGEAHSNLGRFGGVGFGRRGGDYNDIEEMYTASRSEGFGLEVKKRILLGAFVLSKENYGGFYQKALAMRDKIRRELDKVFTEYDLILCPSSNGEATAIGDRETGRFRGKRSDIDNCCANLAGLPAISVQCGLSPGGLPVGVQLMGGRWRDGEVLRAACAFQEATDFHTASPEYSFAAGKGGSGS